MQDWRSETTRNLLNSGRFEYVLRKLAVKISVNKEILSSHKIIFSF